MLISERKNIEKQLFFLSFIIILIPLAQITGPFITDLLVSFTALYYLTVILIFNRKYHYHNKFLNILLIFWLFIFLSSIFSDYKFLTLKPSVTFFRFILFSFAFLLIVKFYKSFLEKFNIFLIIILTILIFDGYFQFIFGKNIIGLEKLRPDRLSSFFHDEMILGSYLSKFLPIVLFFYYQNMKIKIMKNLNLVIIIFLIPLIFLSGERAAFFMSILFCLLIMPFIFSIKKLIISILIFITLGFIIINSSNVIYDRYVNQLKDHIILKKQNELIYFPEHIGIFNSAFESFLNNNKLLGSGVKSFRETCKYNDSKFKEKLEKIKKIDYCSTHPHNYYLQFLTELGLIGFIFLSGVFIYCLTNYSKMLFALFFKKIENKIIFKKYIILLSGSLVILWPLTTSGNFFNNYNSSFIFLHLSLFLNIINEYNDKHKR